MNESSSKNQATQIFYKLLSKAAEIASKFNEQWAVFIYTILSIIDTHTESEFIPIFEDIIDILKSRQKTEEIESSSLEGFEGYVLDKEGQA